MAAGTTVPGGACAGSIENVPPEQIICSCAGIWGAGFTVTVTLNGSPEQVPATGRTVYKTREGILVVLNNRCRIDVCGVSCSALPAIAPGKAEMGASQR